MEMREGKSTVFERMMSELMIEYNLGRMLSDCMAFDTEAIQYCPLRCRIIALGFIKKWTLEELNRRLAENGCQQLYSRSFWEAVLIYTFLTGKSYEEWKWLRDRCMKIRSRINIKNSYFVKSVLTYEEVGSYIKDFSVGEEQNLQTWHLTQEMDQSIKSLCGDEAFFEFLLTNLSSFTSVREKSRYYFCKYLYFYLGRKIDQYLQALLGRGDLQEALSGLTPFKALSQLKRKKLREEEIRSLLSGCALSCGAIFDAFNYYYFEYVSIDWIEVLLEDYGNFDGLSILQKEELASSLRTYDTTYRGLSTEEVLAKAAVELSQKEEELDRMYAIGGNKRGYQKKRSGENAVRAIIKGTIDIDRTTLLCFMLFFGSGISVSEENAITKDRLDYILRECGFSELNQADEFDQFVIKYLAARFRGEFLIEEVTKYARAQQNSFLYHMYGRARNQGKELREAMGLP